MQKKIGRPPLGDQHTIRLSLRLRPELHTWLTQYATDRGITLSRAINTALSSYRDLLEQVKTQ